MKSKIFLAIIIIIAILVGGSLYFWSKSAMRTGNGLAVEKKGTIQGNAYGPPRGMPMEDEEPEEFVKVCARNVSTGKDHCVTGAAGTGYSIDVPIGEYEVYSVFLQPGFENTKVYYTEYIVCGAAPECVSHEKVIIDVSAGQTVEGVDPDDWYK